MSLKGLQIHLEESVASSQKEDFTSGQSKVSVSVRLTEDYISRLDFLANRYGRTRTSFLKILVEEALIDWLKDIGIPEDGIPVNKEEGK